MKRLTNKERAELAAYPKYIQDLILETRRQKGSDTEPVHTWFELSYANYLAIPRSVLQSMPVSWQRQFVALMDDLDTMIDWRQSGVHVTIRDEHGRMKADKFVDYERGRRRIAIKDQSLVPPFAAKKQRLAFLREFFPVFAKPQEIDEKEYGKLAQEVLWGTKVKV